MLKQLDRLIKNNRLGLFVLAIILFWIKTIFAYYTEFTLGVEGLFQTFILWINPFATSIIFLSLGLYFKERKKSAYTLLFIYFIMSLLLYINIVYYREFSDFMTLASIVSSVGTRNTNLTWGVVVGALAMLRAWDVFYWLDFIVLVLITRKNFQKDEDYTKEQKPFYKRYALAATLSGLALLFGNLTLAEIDRPQLLTRTFDRNYIVKYLGVNFFVGYDSVQTIKNNHVRAQANPGDLDEIYNFAKENYAAPNEELFGIAEGRNVITLVLESTQQFVIDFELEDENGNKHVVTPFLNSLYHDESTIRFNNFFHQTGQGKSSDAEVLAENSLFGLPEGSAFQVLGSNNTFQATPKILSEEAGYTTAAFHGNTGTFWNRNDTYRNFGYDYFFDSQFYDMGEGRTLDYGLKDKLFFRDSVEYIEQLPQPFYSKFITLTNHFPYPLEEENATIPQPNTEDETVNQYFQTVRYTDEAIAEFFNWIKDSGLYENSIIVVYGDHFGTSNMRNPHLAPLLGKDPEEWTTYDNIEMQRVPLMFHIPGYTEGETVETYGGQVDLLPTLLHLLGIDTSSYLFMGQDLLSADNKEVVPLRNGTVLTPEHYFIDSSVLDADTGESVSEGLTDEELAEILQAEADGREELIHSDNILNLDLLRFYTPVALNEWEPADYPYGRQMGDLRNHPNRETTLANQLGVETTIELYETDAPELVNQEEEEESDSTEVDYSDELDLNGDIQLK